MRDIRHVLVMLLPLALAAPAGWAASDQVSGRSVCVFPLVNLTSSAAQQEHQKAFSEAVQQEFEAVGFTLVPQRTWAAQAARLSLPPERIREASQALRIAKSVGGDMAVAGFYQMDKDRLLVSVQCYDVAAGTLITGLLPHVAFQPRLLQQPAQRDSDLVQRVIFTTTPAHRPEGQRAGGRDHVHLPAGRHGGGAGRGEERRAASRTAWSFSRPAG